MCEDRNLVVVDFRTGKVSADDKITRKQYITNKALAFNYTHHPITLFIERCYLLRRINDEEKEVILFWAGEALSFSVLQDDSIGLQLAEIEAVDSITLTTQILNAWACEADPDIVTWPYMRLDEVQKRVRFETPEMSPNAWNHLLACYRMVHKSIKRDRLMAAKLAANKRQDLLSPSKQLNRFTAFITRLFKR